MDVRSKVSTHTHTHTHIHTHWHAILSRLPRITFYQVAPVSNKRVEAVEKAHLTPALNSLPSHTPTLPTLRHHHPHCASQPLRIHEKCRHRVPPHRTLHHPTNRFKSTTRLIPPLHQPLILLRRTAPPRPALARAYGVHGVVEADADECLLVVVIAASAGEALERDGAAHADEAACKICPARVSVG